MEIKLTNFTHSLQKQYLTRKGNLALDKNNNLLFLSTNGTLYSLNLINNKIMNWIQNFKPESDVIFKGKPIIVSKDKIIITTNNNITLLNDKGVRLWSTSIKSNISPKNFWKYYFYS